MEQNNKEQLNELALFAGAGGGILGGHLLGWRTVCAVEIDRYAASVLVARQNDGCLPPFPIWDDIRTFDGRPWKGIVEVISGGFPCQDISAAGKGAGIEGERSGLWSEFARIIREVQPQYVLVENSPLLTSRGIYRVLGDLAAMGYNAKWGVLGACDVGAPHKRERIWIVAYPDKMVRNSELVNSQPADLARQGPKKRQRQSPVDECNLLGKRRPAANVDTGAKGQCSIDARQWFGVEPGVGRMVDGVADRVDRLECLGNGQVPAVAALAWEVLKP